MNPELTAAIARSRQQDLQRAAQTYRDSAAVASGPSLVRRLRESIAAAWLTHSAPSAQKTGTPATV